MSEYNKAIPKEVKKEQSRKNRDKHKNLPEYKLKTLLAANTVDRSLLDFEWAWNKLVKQGFKCEITGRKFDFTSKSMYGLSIDRINPKIGYTKENVRFICWWLNAAMGTWGLEKLLELLKEIPTGA